MSKTESMICDVTVFDSMNCDTMERDVDSKMALVLLVRLTENRSNDAMR